MVDRGIPMGDHHGMTITFSGDHGMRMVTGGYRHG